MPPVGASNHPWIMACARLGLASALGLAALAGATATPFDGPPVSAPEATFAGADVVLGGSRVPLAGCDRLLLGTTPAATTAPLAARSGVWLVDGSWLPADSVTAAAVPDAILVRGPLGAGVVLPLAKVLGWGAALPPAAANGDDMVQVASGTMQGRVQGISGGALALTSALSPDKPLALKIDDLIAARLANSAVAARGLWLSVELDPDKPPLKLLPLPGLPLAAVPSVTTDAVLANRELRVEGGRRAYLSDLAPASVEEKGAFDVTWHWKADASLDGGAIRLGGVRYAHGVSTHSACTMSWALDGAYVRLRALVGIADEVRPEGDCAVTISADGKALWTRSSVAGTQKPEAIDLDLAGAKTLVLKVDFGARYDIGDHLTLADAWLLKAK